MQKGVLLLISVTSILPHLFSGSYQSAKHFLFLWVCRNILSSGIFRHFDDNNLPQL